MYLASQKKLHGLYFSHFTLDQKKLQQGLAPGSRCRGACVAYRGVLRPSQGSERRTNYVMGQSCALGS